MDGSPAVIETRGLVKRFAEANAVDGIDLDVPDGGVYGFLGPNGAGKTTTIRILVGLLWPTRGSARIFGEPIVPGAPVLDRVGSLIERPALYPYLSASENVRVFGTAHGLHPGRTHGRRHGAAQFALRRHLFGRAVLPRGGARDRRRPYGRAEPQARRRRPRPAAAPANCSPGRQAAPRPADPAPSSGPACSYGRRRSRPRPGGGAARGRAVPAQSRWRHRPHRRRGRGGG